MICTCRPGRNGMDQSGCLLHDMHILAERERCARIVEEWVDEEYGVIALELIRGGK